MSALYSDAALALARTDCIYAGSHVHSKGCAVAHAYDVGHTDALASVARVTIGAGHVRVGDVLDITHRVIVTGVGDECDVSTDDAQSSHNLHAYNVTAYLVSRPDPDADALQAIAEVLIEIGIDIEDVEDDAPVVLAGLRERGVAK